VQDTSRTTPVRIDADRGAGTLRLEWTDGHETLYDAVTLRWLCPCAYCRGEAGQPGWLDTNPTLTAEQTRLVDLALVGNYAIQATWGDGHHTGYHTFRLLRDHCPCLACARERHAHEAEHGGIR
jgi:ATP-binding protein involved in chromosome partitioning